jgi:hypothetical protein
MNNTLIKNIAFVASGALFGALGGYLVTNKVLSEKFEKDLKEYKESDTREAKLLTNEVRDLKDRISIYEQAGLSFETAQAIAEKNKQAVEAKEAKLRAKDENQNYAKKYNEVKQKVKQVSTEKAMDILKDAPASLDDVMQVENFTPSYEATKEEPYLISVDQYADEHDDFRKASCTYYTEDKVICETSHNEKIDPRHVGQENLDMLDSSTFDILYVRNEYLRMDYEIDKYDGSYSYEVLGEESLNE